MLSNGNIKSLASLDTEAITSLDVLTFVIVSMYFLLRGIN